MRFALVIVVCAGLCGCGQAKDAEAELPARPAAVSFDDADASGPPQIAHGERISRVLGCHGCHGENLQGEEWDNDPKGYGLLWTSNLTRAIPTMTAAQLDALLRKGVHPTRDKIWAMPSQIFQHMSDADLAALTAYLRTIKPRARCGRRRFWGRRRSRNGSRAKSRPRPMKYVSRNTACRRIWARLQPKAAILSA